MNYEFTAEEIKDAARAARVYCPSFTEDEVESLIELEKRIADSGFLETVRGMARLEEERGISCTKAIDIYKELLHQKTELEEQIPDLEKKVESLMAQVKQAAWEYEQVKKDMAKAAQELAQTRNELMVSEKKLEEFKESMEKEKQHIGEEIEDYHQQANVTKEEVETAGRIKADAERHGISLELLMVVTEELASNGNVREKLLLGIKKHNSLNKYLRDLGELGERRKAEVQAYIFELQSQLGQAQARLNAIEEARRSTENIISGLQANVAEEEELRRFYRRYQGRADLLELLATWKRLAFYRCHSPISAATRVFDDSQAAHFWSDRPVVCCPHCGSSTLAFDEKAYQALGLPAGVDFKLQLG
jgi:chromosome segregation ATPase